MTTQQVLDILKQAHKGAVDVRIVYKKPLTILRAGVGEIDPDTTYKLVTRNCIAGITHTDENGTPIVHNGFDKSTKEEEVGYIVYGTRGQGPALQLDKAKDVEKKFFVNGEEKTEAEIQELVDAKKLSSTTLVDSQPEDGFVIYLDKIKSINLLGKRSNIGASDEDVSEPVTEALESEGTVTEDALEVNTDGIAAVAEEQKEEILEELKEEITLNFKDILDGEFHTEQEVADVVMDFLKKKYKKKVTFKLDLQPESVRVYDIQTVEDKPLKEDYYVHSDEIPDSKLQDLINDLYAHLYEAENCAYAIAEELVANKLDKESDAEDISYDIKEVITKLNALVDDIKGDTNKYKVTIHFGKKLENITDDKGDFTEAFVDSVEAESFIEDLYDDVAEMNQKLADNLVKPVLDMIYNDTWKDCVPMSHCIEFPKRNVNENLKESINFKDCLANKDRFYDYFPEIHIDELRVPLNALAEEANQIEYFIKDFEEVLEKKYDIHPSTYGLFSSLSDFESGVDELARVIKNDFEGLPIDESLEEKKMLQVQCTDCGAEFEVEEDKYDGCCPYCHEHNGNCVVLDRDDDFDTEVLDKFFK